MKRLAPNVKVQLEVRVTRASRQLDSETAHTVLQELEHHILLLHMLLFGYFFYRSKTHCPAAVPTSEPQSNIIVNELKIRLQKLVKSLQSVERFLATSRGTQPCLIQQFNTLLYEFPFPNITIDHVVIN